MTQKWQEPFDIKGLTPKEVIEKIAATISALNYEAIRFAHEKDDNLKDEIVQKAYEDGWDDGHNAGMKEGYRDGHRDGIREAATTITE